MSRVALTVLNGFLGGGKTTLLRHLLAQADSRRIIVASIVNDMSTLEVDGVLVNNNERPGPQTRNLASVFGIDIASPAGLDALAAALTTLTGADQQPDHIVLETSGSSHPLPLVRYLRDHPRVALKGVLAVVDAVMLDTDHDGGWSLLPRFRANLQAGRRDVHNLIVEQCLFASQVVLTRADRLPPARLQDIARAVHPINPGAAVVAAAWGNLTLDTLLTQPDYDFHRVERLVDELQDDVDRDSDRHHRYGLDHRVIRDRRPFHPQRLWDACQRFLGTGIHRSKGFFWLPSRDDVALLWNQAAGSIGLELISFWKAGVLAHADSRLDRQERAALEQQVRGAHPLFGDRRCELTVIGASEQLDPFVEALRRCFLTPGEIRRWQGGGQFDDPWPRRIVRLRGA